MAGPGRAVKAACATPRQRLSGGAMSKAEEERKQRLAEALRQNLRRRKAQARGEAEFLPGTGRGTARSAVEGGERSEHGGAGPLHQPAAGPPPRSGED
jgi:hypothetical protein